jgi:hypothetical protein
MNGANHQPKTFRELFDAAEQHLPICGSSRRLTSQRTSTGSWKSKAYPGQSWREAWALQPHV